MSAKDLSPKSIKRHRKYPKFICPSCQNEVEQQYAYYLCNTCQQQYPIIGGIVDFRLRSDRYLSLEEERAKAKRLLEECETSYASMLDYYYQITNDVPQELAARYKAYQKNGPNLAKHYLTELQINEKDIVLDVGCGSGGALISAASQGATIIGMDIALRWLVICQQRLKEQGIDALLICADIESPPFAQNSFSKIIANDLLENVYSVDGSLKKISELLKPKGLVWVAGCNKFCLGPHPTTRLWAIGYFPKFIRTKIVIWLRGVDSLRFINLISPGQVIKVCQKLGLHFIRRSPKIICIEHSQQYPLLDRLLIGVYVRFCQLPVLRSLLFKFGPVFEITFQKD